MSFPLMGRHSCNGLLVTQLSWQTLTCIPFPYSLPPSLSCPWDNILHCDIWAIQRTCTAEVWKVSVSLLFRVSPTHHSAWTIWLHLNNTALDHTLNNDVIMVEEEEAVCSAEESSEYHIYFIISQDTRTFVQKTL